MLIHVEDVGYGAMIGKSNDGSAAAHVGGVGGDMSAWVVDAARTMRSVSDTESCLLCYDGRRGVDDSYADRQRRELEGRPVPQSRGVDHDAGAADAAHDSVRRGVEHASWRCDRIDSSFNKCPEREPALDIAGDEGDRLLVCLHCEGGAVA